jgi:tetratricopeptide (TPR) repeat protein
MSIPPTAPTGGRRRLTRATRWRRWSTPSGSTPWPAPSNPTARCPAAGASASAADQDQSQRIAALASAGIAACKTGIARSPAKFGAYVRLAQLSLLRGQATNDRADVAQAVAAMEDAIDRYPEYPRNLVGLGNCQVELGTCASAEDAIASYRAALALDARRPAWETFRGFSERESAEIEARVQSVSRFLEDECRH